MYVIKREKGVEVLPFANNVINHFYEPILFSCSLQNFEGAIINIAALNV